MKKPFYTIKLNRIEKFWLWPHTELFTYSPSTSKYDKFRMEFIDSYVVYFLVWKLKITFKKYIK